MRASVALGAVALLALLPCVAQAQSSYDAYISFGTCCTTSASGCPDKELFLVNNTCTASSEAGPYLRLKVIGTVNYTLEWGCTTADCSSCPNTFSNFTTTCLNYGTGRFATIWNTDRSYDVLYQLYLGTKGGGGSQNCYTAEGLNTTTAPGFVTANSGVCTLLPGVGYNLAMKYLGAAAFVSKLVCTDSTCTSCLGSTNIQGSLGPACLGLSGSLATNSTAQMTIYKPTTTPPPSVTTGTPPPTTVNPTTGSAPTTLPPATTTPPPTTPKSAAAREVLAFGAIIAAIALVM